MKSFKLALIQMSPTDSTSSNLDLACNRIRQAAANGAKLVCLPEIFLGPYFCQTEEDKNFDLAQPIPGPTTEVLGAIARELQTVIIAPLFERQAAGVYYNSLAVIDSDGTYLGKYRKMHIPDDPAYYEKYYFSPGDSGFKVFETSVGKIGCLICWDQWFPEAARLTALKGAEILLYPTAIGWHPSEKAQFGETQLEAWKTVQRGHAIANGVFVAAVNRVGHEKSPEEGDGIEFWGNSFVCDPQGKVLSQAPPDSEEILYADIDRSRIETIRRHWPFFRDRRIDAYGGIEQRYLDNQ